MHNGGHLTHKTETYKTNTVGENTKKLIRTKVNFLKLTKNIQSYNVKMVVVIPQILAISGFSNWLWWQKILKLSTGCGNTIHLMSASQCEKYVEYTINNVMHWDKCNVKNVMWQMQWDKWQMHYEKYNGKNAMWKIKSYKRNVTNAMRVKQWDKNGAKRHIRPLSVALLS